MSIDELQEKLDNPAPGDTFNPSEVQQLIDWHVQQAISNEVTQATITANITETSRVVNLISDSVQTLMAHYKQVPTPQLEVITDESSQGQQA